MDPDFSRTSHRKDFRNKYYQEVFAVSFVFIKNVHFKGQSLYEPRFSPIYSMKDFGNKYYRGVFIISFLFSLRMNMNMYILKGKYVSDVNISFFFFFYHLQRFLILSW